MKKIIVLICLFQLSFVFSQNEKSPVYKGCENESIDNLESCFTTKLKIDVLKEFRVPDIVTQENYKGNLRIIFKVTKKGDLKILYINSIYKELEEEAKRVFKLLPNVQAATYNGRTIEKQYILPLSIPLSDNIINNTIQNEIDDSPNKLKEQLDINVVNSEKDNFPEHTSHLSIPFTHQFYNQFLFDYNQGNNSHGTVKPLTYSDITKHSNLTEKKEQLLKKANSWFSKKLWNEHLISINGKLDNDALNYWFTINPAFDVQIGKDNSDLDYTYNNTRGININGGLGKKFSFSTSVYESQGRFADYINAFNNENKIVIGRGKFKRFNDDAFDYPAAEGYISYTPNNTFNFKLGNGKNFIGDGYRSLLLSDVATSYPYFKISTKFWKIKYTNLWMFLDDIRPNITEDGSNLRKYVAIHHLSYNVTKKLNIGLFETVITNNEDKNGFDVNYFNPLIFYRVIEFNRGSTAGNALIGLNASYKWNKNIFLYGQFLLDELTISRLKEGNGYWANKFAIQAGFKYYNAFKVPNLYLQGELNIVRPYTYSHRKSTLNYGHFNQPLAHLWGSNFYEFIGIASYTKGRWFGNAKLIYGKKGFDFEDDTDIENSSYGGDIYVSYNERVTDFGNDIAQGNKTSIFSGEFKAGYLVNPSTNLKLFAGFNYRDFTPKTNSENFNNQNNTWFTFGLKTDLFNSYFDF